MPGATHCAQRGVRDLAVLVGGVFAGECRGKIRTNAVAIQGCLRAGLRIEPEDVEWNGRVVAQHEDFGRYRSRQLCVEVFDKSLFFEHRVYP